MADKKALRPSGGSPGQKDRLHAATSIQSAVMPDDYPLEERREQVAVVDPGSTAKQQGKVGKK